MTQHANTQDKPNLGYGLGLRTDHYQTIVDERPEVDWFEIISENYMVGGGKPLHFLDKVRENYPLVMHGVSLSIGSTDPLDKEYLKALKGLAERVEPAWISDHLCWTGVDGVNMHDLLPLPYNEQTIDHVVDRISQVQDILGRQLMMENLSSYVTYNQSTMSEWDFLSEVAERSDCLILLDVNNVYVSSVNHSFDPMDYILALPAKRIWQIHIAGHTTNESGSIMIDTHDMPVKEAVWNLYADTIKHLGPVSTMIERDDNIPPLSELLDELSLARTIGEANEQ
jgi:uncharacterized protein (UPF0276 family)